MLECPRHYHRDFFSAKARSTCLLRKQIFSKCEFLLFAFALDSYYHLISLSALIEAELEEFGEFEQEIGQGGEIVIEKLQAEFLLSRGFNLMSPRVDPPVFGRGLLEAIPEETLLAFSNE